MSLFRFDNITYKVGESESRTIVVSGQVDEGAVLAITGPSGSGKTTLLRNLARLQKPISGQAWLSEKDWTQYSPCAWRKSVHYLAQKPSFLSGTVMDNLKWPFSLAVNRGEKTFNEELAMDLAAKMLLSEDVLQRDANLISGGEAVRVSLLRSILTSPRVLLADEPTSALDEKARECVLSVLKDWLLEQKGALILVSHLDDLRYFPSRQEVAIAI